MERYERRWRGGEGRRPVEEMKIKNIELTGNKTQITHNCTSTTRKNIKLLERC